LSVVSLHTHSVVCGLDILSVGVQTSSVLVINFILFFMLHFPV
jgi:hypothetical protein